MKKNYYDDFLKMQNENDYGLGIQKIKEWLKQPHTKE